MQGKVMCRAGLWAAIPVLVANLALAAGADSRLADAAANQDKQTVRALVRRGANVNTPQADGATALLWAAHWDDLESADLLLRAHADVNAANDHGVTPLALACENRSFAMVEKLLAAGAHANAAQTSGLTPLITAARTGNGEVVKALLAHGANVNAAIVETKQTALMWATSERRADIVRMLLAAGADVHPSSRRGFTPLLYAARNGDIEIARLLLGAGVGVNETGSDGTHALPLSIVSGQDAFAMFLLDQGADPNGRLYGVGALHAAVGPVDPWLREWLHSRQVDAHRSIVGLDVGRRLTLVKSLLAHKADPNLRITTSTAADFYLTPKKGAFETFSIGTGDLRGATPLWVAAFSRRGVGVPADDEGGEQMGSADVEIMRALLTAGADHRLTTNDKTTPLMVAAGLGRGGGGGANGRPSRRQRELERKTAVLVEAGADVNAANEAGFTALHGAAFAGANEVVEYLAGHGAKLNVQDFRGRTPYRIAEGAKQGFSLSHSPDTATLLKRLGADVTQGPSWEALERGLARKIEGENGSAGREKRGQQ